MLICIADCNHGFFEPEKQEAERLGVTLSILKCSQSEIIDLCQGADVVVVQRLKIDGKIIDQIPSCKVVTRYGVGLDNIDCEAMETRGIKVVNFPGFCTEEVANHALAAIMFFYKRMDVLQPLKKQLAKYWGNPGRIKEIKSASQTTIGVVGAGRIGRSVIDRSLSCGFKVLVYDPYVDIVKTSVQFVSNIESIFKHSDIVTIHVPLTPETHHMINSELLSLMTVGSVLVNTSRGEVICSSDLIESLHSNLRGAFVDVWDPEPPDCELFLEPNVHISPHCAFYSQQSLDFLKRQVIIKSVEVL